MAFCYLHLRVLMPTLYSENIAIIGNTPAIGNWDPSKALPLVTSPMDYPYWYTVDPIIIEIPLLLEFKLVVMRDRMVIRWENLPDNRRYLLLEGTIGLKFQEGLWEGEEFIPLSELTTNGISLENNSLNPSSEVTYNEKTYL